MPELKPEFTVKAPVEKTWAFLSDMERLGGLIPHCTVSTAGPNTYLWSIAVKAAFVSKTFNLTITVDELDDAAHHASFSGSGDGLTVAGMLDIAPTAETESAVKYALNLQAKGMTGKLVDSVAGSRMDDYEARFVRMVKQELE